MDQPTPGSGPRPTNRLAGEQSPYLRQHQHNPVDWYPWGEEAFARARELDRPIFLSIGYATCHWCHVMERESFEDEAVAARLNEVCVPVKVDREERPDLDDLYMTVCHLLTGGGGWPLTVFLTPERRPFFAGTYFPKESRFGRVGLLELMDRVETLWRDRRLDALRSADTLTEALAQETAGTAGGDAEGLDDDVLHGAADHLKKRFDPTHGGFGRAPKFPTPHNLIFLLRHGARQGDDEVVRMVCATLDAMRAGGLFDQVGLGFHRYSTDAQWLLPHFEKMLYDQALLALAYLEAAQVTGEAAYRRTAEEIFTYVLRDLRGAHGAFLSAEDADSEGEEGRFYVWTAAELREVLAPELADLALDAWGVTEEGNVLDEATHQRTGANVLHRPHPSADLAARHGLTPEALDARLEEARGALFARREGRPRPLCDDKVLTDLNGLMIAALARGAQVLGRPELAAAAREAADFLWATLRRPPEAADDGAPADPEAPDPGDGAPADADAPDALARLWHRYRAGEAGIPAFLDDYAFLVWGLLELYGATFDPSLLARARALQAALDAHHWDAELGGYFLTADDGEALLFRRKTLYDGAIPSGNSVAALNLLRLAHLTGDPALEERAAALMAAFQAQARALPAAHCFLLTAADYALAPGQEIVIAGARGAADTAALLDVVRSTYLPRAAVLLRPAPDPASVEGHATAEAEANALDDLVGFTAGLGALEGKATAYVCQDRRCDLPVTDPDALRERLADASPPAADPGRAEPPGR